MKCAIFEQHSYSCVVYFRFSGTLFPVSMIDGVSGYILWKKCVKSKLDNTHCFGPDNYFSLVEFGLFSETIQN